MQNSVRWQPTGREAFATDVMMAAKGVHRWGSYQAEGGMSPHISAPAIGASINCKWTPGGAALTGFRV